MKKILALSVLFLTSFTVFCQNADSLAAVKTADSLLQVCFALTSKRDYDKALEINANAEKIALEKLGTESASYGSVCFNYGRILYFKRDFTEAEKWYFKSKAIREKILGKMHPDYAWSLNNLAGLYRDMGDYEKAEGFYLESKSIREKVLGKEHPDYASSLNNLAILYDNIGNYEKSEALFVETLAIRKKILGKEHPGYASSLNNLAYLYYGMGKYEKAEPLYVESLAIRKKILGKEHPDYAASLNNLAILYYNIGNYEKAEVLHVEALAIREKILGKEHPDYAASLNNLAVLYMNMGNYEKAEPLYIEALAIREKVLGKEHPLYAASLNNLAILYWDMGDYEKAEGFYLESQSIREKVLGKEHPDYAASLNNLANLYSIMGKYEKAEPFYVENLAILGKKLGKEHSDYASSLDNLANLYWNLGTYEKAEPFYVEAHVILEKTLGKEHPDYASSLYNLALLYWENHKSNTAQQIFLESAKIEKSLLTKASLHLSEQELSSYSNQLTYRSHERLSFAQLHSGMSLSCYDDALFSKGFLLNTVLHLNKLALSDSIITEKYYHFKSCHRRLAAEYSKPIAERKNVAELEEKASTLEKELARTVAGFGEALRQVNWKEIQAALQPGEVAIEFVHYEFVNPKRTDSTMYAALVLRPQDTQPHFILLFEQKQLDTLLAKTQRSDQSAGALYAARTGIVLDEKPAYGTELYHCIWKPLDSLLQGVKTVCYSPSGLLHRVNLAAIPTDSGYVLADQYTLRQMNSTRSLVIKTPESELSGYTAALFGGIQYDGDSTALSSAALAARGSEAPSSRSALEYASGVRRDTARTWTYLPGTHTEVENLQRQMRRSNLKVKTHTGLSATEERLKALGRDTTKSPDILHIATHGFFFDDPEKRREQRFGDENVFRWNENPLFRSGLILAGADHAWQTARPYANLEDGILTAYEISHLNLTNTKLVVLSACETGLGQIQGNEGVYGLQRAFKIAGAKYLIMSLWQVPDQQTSLLMTTFYKKWLEEKMEIPEAFRAAQKEMRERGFDPYQWAGFVLVE